VLISYTLWIVVVRYNMSVTSNKDTKITSVIMSLVKYNYHNNIHHRPIVIRPLYNNTVPMLYTNYQHAGL
jgi:hypothetical protein